MQHLTRGWGSNRHAHATDPMPDVIVVPFQADLDHGVSFEINGTHLADGLRPAIAMVNQGIAIT